jgi:hypothetical protein
VKLSPITSLKEADLQIPEGPITGTQLRETFRRLFAELNPYFDSLNKLGAKGVTFADNVACEVASVQFTHGVPQLVSLKTLTRAGSALVLSADGQVPFAAALQMQQTASKSPPLASVTVYFRDTSAAKVKCVILLLPEGAQTTTVPAP